jgi:hypothetical protein
MLQSLLPKYQVLNAGVRNYGLKLIIDWYRYFHERFDPEVVIIQIPLFCRQPYQKIQNPDKKIHYTMSCGSYSLLNHNVITEDQFLSASQEFIVQDVERLKEFVLSIKAKPVVLLYKSWQDKFWFMGNLVDMHHQEIIKMCSDNNVSCISDKSLHFRTFKKDGMLFDNTHPNEKGNEKITGVIYEFLQQNQIVYA